MQSRDFEAALERCGSALRQAAANILYHTFPDLAVASLQVDAARLRSPAIPQLFSRHLRQIDPSLNDDLLDLYGGSEQALANHFTFLNRSHEFAAGIDWEIRESPAWLNELHAFDYALDLSMTYRISAEETYARHLRHLIAHWIAENPPLRSTGWLPLPLARRVHNWILAADLARADWEHNPEFLSLFSQSLALQCTQLIRQGSLTRSALETQDRARALLLAGKYFGDNGGVELRARALEMVRLGIEIRLRSGHALAQASPGSELGFAATLLECLLFQGQQDETELWQRALREVLSVIEGAPHPDGGLPMFGVPARANFAECRRSGGCPVTRSHLENPGGEVRYPALLAPGRGREGQLRATSHESMEGREPMAASSRPVSRGRAGWVRPDPQWPNTHVGRSSRGLHEL